MSSLENTFDGEDAAGCTAVELREVLPGAQAQLNWQARNCGETATIRRYRCVRFLPWFRTYGPQ